MVVLTDLPDELLLPIVADVSPLYIDSLALSCKRLHGLCTDVIREHDRIRSEIPTNKLLLSDGFETGAYDLLQRFLQNPSLAEYPTSWNFKDAAFTADVPENLIDEINFHAQRGPYAYLFDTDKSRPNVAELVIPLVITQLVNVRKIRIRTIFAPFSHFRGTQINTTYATYLIEFMSKIMKTIHNPKVRVQDSSILGRLKEVEIDSHDNGSGGTELPLLLSMLPTLRKIHVFRMRRERPYVCPHKYRVSNVTDILLDGKIDSEYILELIQRTKSLHSFTYQHWIIDSEIIFEPRRLLTALKEHARQSLIFVCLVTWLVSQWSSDNLDCYPGCPDLSLGSLRELKVLKYLVTGVEMFIKTTGSSETGHWKGTVQRLVSWLPASLETLVLVERFGEWDADKLRMLFRGFRNQKKSRLPNLKHIKFYRFGMSDKVVLNAIKVACWETGVTISYTTFSWMWGWYCHPPKSLQGWEDYDWKEISEDDCEI